MQLKTKSAEMSDEAIFNDVRHAINDDFFLQPKEKDN